MRLLIFGTGGHAKSVVEAIQARGEHTVLGLINIDGSSVDFLPGIEVLGSNANALTLAKQQRADGAVIALGDRNVRKCMVGMLRGNLAFPMIVHPAAWVSPSASLGEGVVVFAGAIVGASTSIGRHTIVNTRSSVDHDCVIGDFVHVCPGVTIAGHVTVGNDVWVGVGSTVVDHLAIPDAVFIKAGSLVTRKSSFGEKSAMSL